MHALNDGVNSNYTAYKLLIIVLWRSRLTRCPLKALFMGANPIRMTKNKKI